MPGGIGQVMDPGENSSLLATLAPLTLAWLSRLILLGSAWFVASLPIDG